MDSQTNISDAAAARMLEAALAYHRAGRLDEAEAIYRQILSGRPDHADALHFLGVAFGQRGQPERALELIGRAIALRPDIATYHANFGEFSRHVGRFDQSIASYRHAIQLKGDDANFHNGLGVTLAEGRQIELAIAEFRAAVGLKNDYADALNNLGGALREAGELDEALEVIRKAIALQPRMHGAYNNLGLALFGKGRYAEAIDAYRVAISLKPDYAIAHSNLSQPYLLLGDYERGWAEFEWRLGVVAIAGARRFDRPRWDGGDAGGKKIFVHPEQGFGDMIQFVRFLPELARRGAEFVLESPRELSRIFRQLGEIVIEGEPIPPHDLHCSLLSLGRILGIRAESIPAPIPYLKADPRLVKEWGGRFDGKDDRVRVGLVWGGRASHTNNRNRSIQFKELAPLASVEKAAFYSLQKGEPAAEASDPPPELKLIDWTNELGDFADTAALLQHLDLLITVDTAVAHLAGAMGKTVWLLVPFVPDWRWMLGREESGWYPTMRLFRQEVPRAWGDVLRGVAGELGKFAVLRTAAK